MTHDHRTVREHQMNARETPHWRVTLRRSDVYVFRDVQAASEEAAVDQVRELLSHHDDWDFLDNRDESFDAEPEDE
jgi:hypothetical protein